MKQSIRSSDLAGLLVFALAAVGGGSMAYAQDAPDDAPTLVQASDGDKLKTLVGRSVFVQGVVESAAWSESGKVFVLKFKDAQTSRFQAAAFERQRGPLNASFGGDISKALTGQHVRLSGVLGEYKGAVKALEGSLEIIIASPSQITIMPAADAAGG